MRSIQEKWRSFEHCVPAGASAEQQADMKNCFFAGAMGVLAIVHEIAVDPAIGEDAGAQILEGLRQEVFAHAQNLKAEVTAIRSARASAKGEANGQ